MAHVITKTKTYVDDLDGQSPADTELIISVFGLTYKLDLSADNAHRVLAGLKNGAPEFFQKSAKKVSPKLVREWAAENGIVVSRAGIVPQEIVDKYLASVFGQ